MTSVKTISYRTKSKSNRMESTTWIILQENVMNVGPPPKPKLFLLWINSHKFHYFGIMKTYSFLNKKIEKKGILKINFEISEVWNVI